MKIILKNSIKTKQEKTHTMAERYILEVMDYGFIVKLHYAFQNSKKLYLLVDFLAGVHLFSFRGNSSTFLEGVGNLLKILHDSMPQNYS